MILSKTNIKDIIFFIEIDFTFMEAIEPRKSWISKLPYEVLYVEINSYVKILLNPQITISRTWFRTF